MESASMETAYRQNKRIKNENMIMSILENTNTNTVKQNKRYFEFEKYI